MGWKSFKEKFEIKHFVQIRDGQIKIGSSYVHDIISIDPVTGRIFETASWSNVLNEYPLLKNASKEEIVKILQEKDTFEKSIPVFTYSEATIIEDFAEEVGWPNITHSGRMMMDNTFFLTREEAVEEAIDNNGYSIKFAKDRVVESEKELGKSREHLKEVLMIKDKLEAMRAKSKK